MGAEFVVARWTGVVYVGVGMVVVCYVGVGVGVGVGVVDACCFSVYSVICCPPRF